MASPERIDYLHGLRVACGTGTTATDGTLTISSGSVVVVAAMATIEAAAPAVTDLCVLVNSTTGGEVDLTVVDSTDATAGTHAMTLHYIILGY